MREEIAAAAKTDDLAAAAQKLTEEMRWLDEEHMRCRAEDEAKMLAAVQGLREELTESHQALQRAVVEGVIEDGQPGALSLLQQNESRVASLADAVTALNVHMETMRVKEVTALATHHSPLTTHHLTTSSLTTHHTPPQVAALAEERVAALEERLGAAYGAELAGAQQRSNNAVESLTVRLQALEAAVQQEQQSSLKALQAILHSAHAR